MASTNVVVIGALGRAGRTAVDLLSRESDLELVGAVDLQMQHNTLECPVGNKTIPAARNLESLLDQVEAHVIVDFTLPAVSLDVVRTAARRGQHVVIGTTGFTDQQLADIDDLAQAAGIGVLTGSLAFGVVLTSHLAAIAARYFDHVEIIDLGKHGKTDSPSGAAGDFARAMLKARGKPFSHSPADLAASRGQNTDGIRIHSLRLSDCYLHEQIIFGTPEGTLLTIGCELTSEKYMYPGLIIAIRQAPKNTGLVYGLDHLFLDSNREKEPAGWPSY